MTLRSGAEIAVGVFVILVLFLFLGGRGLNEPDEGRYAEVSREMLLDGNILTPHLNGIAHFQKPPLIYWAAAASMALFGMNERSARLPAALAALGTTWLTFVLGRMYRGRLAGLIAACVLVSTVGFFWMARLLTPDMLLTFWITAAITCLARFAAGEPRAWQWGFFGAMGLGFLTKGPMALVVPISAALGWRALARRQGISLPLAWARGLIVTGVIGLSWFVVMCVQNPTLLDYFVRYEFIARITSHAHGRVQPWWFFVPVLAGGLLPWSLCFPAIAVALRRRLRARTPLAPLHGLLLGWTVPPFIILSLAGSKLATYVLPLFPACALVVSMWWIARCDQRRTGPFVLSAGTALLLLGSAVGAVRANDALGRQASLRALVQVLTQRPDFDQAQLFKCGVRADGYEFYSGRLVTTTVGEADVVLPLDATQAGRLIASREDCEHTFHDQVPAYGLIRSKRFAKSFARFGWQIVAHAGDFLLITNSR